jgi:riboflavin synthase
MFTGIIQAIGHIDTVEKLGDGFRLHIDAGKLDMSDVQLGDSIALQGACMTVVSMTASHFAIDISAESLDKTTGLEHPGYINLEKALRAHDRLGGHIVSGHVDGTGHVSHFEQIGESWELRIMAPFELAKYLAYKGSITVNGVSLTVNSVQDFFNTDGPLDLRGSEISINIIPHTVDNTALGSLKTGSKVNLEIDTVARYVERMLRVDASLGNAAALKAHP